MKRVANLIAGAALTALAIAAGGLISAVATASAADDQVFWGNTGSNTISSAYLDGSGGGLLDTTGATVNSPAGVAIDPVRNRVWWTEAADSQIAYASLSGGGGADLVIPGITFSSPVGLVVAGGKLYFASAGTNQIFSVNVDGSGATEIDTTGATVDSPHGVAVDAARQRIYWVSHTGNKISYAELDGSGAGDLDTTGASAVNGPNGVALDPGTGRIWWANRYSGEISYANADGSGGGGDLDLTGATSNSPYGVAIDTVTGRIYWANHGGSSISYAALDGSGGADLDTTGGSPSAPNMPVLLQAPIGTGAPSVAGSPVVGAPLSCSGASWADPFPQQLYRLPRTLDYEWYRDGARVPTGGATAYFAPAPGDYGCKVIGLNPAGMASQLSARLPVIAALTAGKAKLNRKGGTAKLTVTPAAAGSLKVSGKGVKAQTRTVAAAGRLTVPIKPKGATKRKLAQKGKAKLTVTAEFTPTGGVPTGVPKRVTLIKRIAA